MFLCSEILGGIKYQEGIRARLGGRNLKQTSRRKVWRKYLYENLLGNSELISEILHIFEENEQIGFIYPEIFYRSSRLPFILNKNNTLYLNQFLNRMFPGNRAGKEIKFPLGNMFWARVDAVRQAFSHKFIYMYDKNEAEASNITHHANEAIWLYFVKQNNYSYQINK